MGKSERKKRNPRQCEKSPVKSGEIVEENVKEYARETFHISPHFSVENLPVKSVKFHDFSGRSLLLPKKQLPQKVENQKMDCFTECFSYRGCF